MIEIKDRIVYIVNVNLVTNEIYNYWLKKEPTFFKKNEFENYANEKDKKAHFLTKLFIYYFFKSKNLKLSQLDYDLGKPIVKNSDNLFFSISHNDDYFCFISHSKSIGIDILNTKSKSNIASLKTFFKSYKIPNWSDQFNYWTTLEAVKKCNNANDFQYLVYLMSSSKLFYYFFWYWEYLGYRICVCAKRQVRSIEPFICKEL